MQTVNQRQPKPRLMLERVEQVSERIQLGRTWIWAAVKRGDFPAPKRISPRCTRWDSALVDSWIQNQLSKDKK